MKTSTAEEKELARVYHRFYLALQLRDLCNEMPVHRVAQKYETPRGTVQTLAQTCQGFAAGMIKFCEQMGWGVMAAALDHFSDRLKAGAKADLLALAKITFVKSRTARVFWDNGLRSVAAVANADPQELVPILLQAQPNKLRLEAKDEDKYREKLLNKAKVIADSANRLWRKLSTFFATSMVGTLTVVCRNRNATGYRRGIKARAASERRRDFRPWAESFYAMKPWLSWVWGPSTILAWRFLASPPTILHSTLRLSNGQLMLVAQDPARHTSWYQQLILVPLSYSQAAATATCTSSVAASDLAGEVDCVQPAGSLTRHQQSKYQRYYAE